MGTWLDDTSSEFDAIFVSRYVGIHFDLNAERGTWPLWPSGIPLSARERQTTNAASHPFRTGSSAFGRTTYACTRPESLI